MIEDELYKILIGFNCKRLEQYDDNLWDRAHQYFCVSDRAIDIFNNYVFDCHWGVLDLGPGRNYQIPISKLCDLILLIESRENDR